MNTQACQPDIINLIPAALDPGEEALELCDFTVVGTKIIRTALLTNRYVRFMGFKRNWLGKNPQLVFNASVPIHKVSTIVTSEEKQWFFGPKLFGLTFWWEGTQENLVTAMVEAGKSFATELKKITSAPPQVLAGSGQNETEA